MTHPSPLQTSSSYSETLICLLPSYLPSNNYTVWTCSGTYGCGWYNGALLVPLTVSTASPATGSGYGGLNVTLTGLGFSSNASEVLVFFGSAPCAVLSSSSTQVCGAEGWGD